MVRALKTKSALTKKDVVQSYIIVVVIGTVIVTGMSILGMLAAVETTAATTVPGQASRYDSDANGYPDRGMAVTGKYVSVYAYDGFGDYYWNLGDGRIQGSVSSVAELDQGSLTRCQYQVKYRGMFENDPYLDSGWIKNEINCSGVEKGTYNSTVVHQSDPRFTGNPDWAVWGDWEYHVNTESGAGNLVRPYKPVGQEQ